jgi:hypothetical protein
MKTKRMALTNRLPIKIGIILPSIGLFVFFGYLETFEVNPNCLWENLPDSCYSEQQSSVDASKNVVKVKLESVYERHSTEIGARLGLRKWYPKSEGIPMILLIFIGVWGTAIIFVLGLILYWVVIEPWAKKKKAE